MGQFIVGRCNSWMNYHSAIKKHLAIAKPEMLHVEATVFNSTRPSGPGSPETGLRPWGGASGDPEQNWTKTEPKLN